MPERFLLHTTNYRSSRGNNTTGFTCHNSQFVTQMDKKRKGDNSLMLNSSLFGTVGLTHLIVCVRGLV